MPACSWSALISSQRGRNPGGQGVGGCTRFLTSISALPTETEGERIVCSSSGASATCAATSSKLQVHQLLVDLHALGVQPAGDRAGESLDLKVDAAKMVRQVARDELHAPGGEQHRPHQHERRDDERHDQDAGEDEQYAAAHRSYSLGRS